jgi:AcrR family transcriptional regulator
MRTFQPRKRPVQGRSKATVEAILEGTIRVLVSEGFETLTTTRVAEVAGVGVGTLYQYFPAKESLVLALLEREMTILEAALLAAIVSSADQPLEAQVTATLDALIVHKKAHAELGAALQAHMPRFDGVRVVRATVRRIVSGFAAMIRASMPDTVDDSEVQLVAMVIATAVQGAVDGALDLSPTAMRARPFAMRSSASCSAICASRARTWGMRARWRCRVRRGGTRLRSRGDVDCGSEPANSGGLRGD